MYTRFLLIILLFAGSAALCSERPVIHVSSDIPPLAVSAIMAERADEQQLAERLKILSRAIDELALLNNRDTLKNDEEDVRKLKALRASINDMIVDIDHRIARVDSVRMAQESSSNFLVRSIKSGLSERKLTWLKDIRDFLQDERSRLDDITQGISKVRFTAMTKAMQAKLKIASKIKGLF